jgi:hypothetical protein
VRRLERLRDGSGPFLLYPLLALLSFPTFGTLIAGDHGLGYVLDVFDLPRSGVSADWLANGLTLWNTHLTAGNALLAQVGSFVTPDVAIGLIVGPFGAYAIVAWLTAVVAGLSMHLFLRDSLRLSTAAVIGGATIYLFGFWHYAYGLSAIAAPLLFWLIDRAVVPAPGRWRFILGGAVIGAFLCYDGISQVVILFAGLQLGYVVITARERQDLASRLGIWAGTWILALCLFAPVLITQLVALPISQRTIWDLRALYDPTPIQAVRDSVDFYSAVVIGVPVGGGLGGSPGRYGTYFLGAIGLVLLVLGMVGATRDRRARYLLFLLIAIPLIDLIAVLLTPLQDQLGFLKSFQVVRIRHAFPFVLAANAALGLDIVVATLIGNRAKLWTGRWRGAVVAASAVPLALALVVALANVYRLRLGLVQLDVRAVGWVLLVIALSIGAVAIVGVFATALMRDRSPTVGHRAGIVLLVLLVVLAGERAMYAHGERLVGPNLGSWADHLGLTPGQAFLLRQPGIDVDRVLTFGEDANRMGAVGLLQTDGYEAIYPLTYHNYFGALIDPQLNVDPADATYYRSWGNRAITFGPRVDPDLVALVGARWLYVKGDAVPTVPGIVARFHVGDVTVYEVPDVLPRAFLAGDLDVEPSAAAVVDRLASANLADLRTNAFVAAGSDVDTMSATGVGAAGAGGSGGSGGSATISSYTPDRVVVSIAADGPAALVLTDVMAPGWTAQRDGQDAPIATVDGAFRGVAVDRATRQVVFTYRPWFTLAGLIVAAIAFVVTVGWTIAVRRHDQRAVDRVGGVSASLVPGRVQPGEADG